MSWEREILGQSVEDLVRRNSPQLLASLMQSAAENYLDAIRRHADEMERVRAQLTEAERIGVRVQRLAVKGRKTVRLADLTGDADA